MQTNTSLLHSFITVLCADREVGKLTKSGRWLAHDQLLHGQAGALQKTALEALLNKVRIHPRLSPPYLRLAWIVGRLSAGASAGTVACFLAFCLPTRTRMSLGARSAWVPWLGATSGAEITCGQEMPLLHARGPKGTEGMNKKMLVLLAPACGRRLCGTCRVNARKIQRVPCCPDKTIRSKACLAAHSVE